MAQSVLITLLTAGVNTGPFDLYSNVDSYLSPFETGVPKSSLLLGYLSTSVPDAATTIRLTSDGLCTNNIDLTIITTTTTTTSTSTTTTTTTTVLDCNLTGTAEQQ